MQLKYVGLVCVLCISFQKKYDNLYCTFPHYFSNIELTVVNCDSMVFTLIPNVVPVSSPCLHES